MPSLVDIFNPSFFMFLGILVLVAALLVVYFESKMREQNHKMASMLSLITCIAEEMNDIKSQSRVGGSYPIQPFNPNSNLETTNINNTHIITNDLIQVSDDSESDSDSNDSDSDSEDNDSESGSDSDSENGSVKEVIEIGEQSDIKVLKLNISSMNNIDENNNIDDLGDFNNLDKLNDLDDLNDLDEDHFSDDSVSVDSSEDKPDTEEQNNDEQKNDEINILDLNLKSINISNLEEVKNPNSIDYKKFTLNKLRSTVVEKGLVDDSSKLKKNELLKLLGCSNE